MTFAASPSRMTSLPNIMSISGRPTSVEIQSGSQETPTTVSQMDRILLLQEFYDMERPGEIFLFLYHHPILIEIVLEAVAVLKNIFGMDAPLSLELVQDPETNEQELFALVGVDMEPDEALQKLQEFDDTWLLDREEITKGLFNVDVMFL